jgi:hypothetical protein
MDMKHRQKDNTIFVAISLKLLKNHCIALNDSSLNKIGYNLHFHVLVIFVLFILCSVLEFCIVFAMFL